VSNAAALTCKLYVNGVYRAVLKVAKPISLSGVVGIGYAAQNRSEWPAFFDNFDGVIYGVAIYNRTLSAGEIQAHSDAYFLPPQAMLAETAVYVMEQADLGKIAPELEQSLLAKIDAASAALDKGNPNEAKVVMNGLKALINQVEAQIDKKITPDVATEIIRRASAVIRVLGG
jgi:hypothetical protein